MADRTNQLWICPKCGNGFVTPNMWHSCGDYSLDALFIGCEPHVRETFDALQALVQSLADVRVIPQKTRIVFQTRTRFAGGTPKKTWFDAGFIFFRRHPSPRFHKIEDYAGRWFGHRVKLVSPSDVDDEVRDWLMESLRYGDQRGP